MSTLTIQLPDDLGSHLKTAARRAGKTPARFVREAIEERVGTPTPRRTASKSLYELSRDLCGSVSGGPDDLASNKDHLNGYGSCKR
jgi:hypothetical protein